MEKMKLEHIARAIGGEVEGDPDVEITGVSGLEEGKPGTLIFAENEDAQAKGEATAAGAIILPKGTLEAKKPAIRTDHPRAAFARAAAFFAPDPFKGQGIHPSAVIDPTAVLTDVVVHSQVSIGARTSIGKGTVIGHGTYIGPDVSMGRDVLIYPGVVILHNTEIGNGCIIQSGAVIGADGFSFFPGPQGNEKMPHLGRVIIEDNVEIGANAVIDRATLTETRIQQGSKVGSLVIVGHNAQIGRGCLLVPQVAIGGSTTLGHRVVIGGQSAVADHLTVDDDVQIGAKSGVHKNLKAGKYFGTPAVEFTRAWRNFAALNRLEQYQKRVRKLEEEVRELKTVLEKQQKK